MLQTLYELLIKKEADIVADTIELACKKTIYDPDRATATQCNPAFTCTAVSKLFVQRKITKHANVVTRQFLMGCLHPYACFENYVNANPKKYPHLVRWDIPVDGAEMQRARIRWLRGLIELLRTDM
jgi:hypothetical protein